MAPNHSVYTTIDGILYEKATQTLIAYPEGRGATTLIVPEGIRAIGAEAFYWCDSLRSIELPGSLTAIGERARWSAFDRRCCVLLLRFGEKHGIARGTDVDR